MTPPFKWYIKQLAIILLVLGLVFVGVYIAETWSIIQHRLATGFLFELINKHRDELCDNRFPEESDFELINGKIARIYKIKLSKDEDRLTVTYFRTSSATLYEKMFYPKTYVSRAIPIGCDIRDQLKAN